MARQAARLGAKLVLCARDRDELAAAEHELSRQGAQGVAGGGGARVPAQVEQLLAQAASAFGNIDVLINNAGTIAVGPIETMTAYDFEEAMTSNF